MQVNINPKILIWAREERGFSAKKVAEQLKIGILSLDRWEYDGKDIPFDKLELIAKICKRQTAVFFLPNVPAKTKKIKDCRNLTSGSGNFSPETLLAMRRTERYLHESREIIGIQNLTKQYDWLKSFSGKKGKTDEEIDKLRNLLDSPLDGKINQSKNDAAFRHWRSKIEERLGIFIFQFPMPEKELDGFSFAFEEFPYAIVINNQKAPVRKIFTLFHELAHIFKHNPGVCKTDFDSSDKQFDVELECNSYAGKFLVPGQSVVAANSVNDIFLLARPFNVSGETYLRRLFEKQIISQDIFLELLVEVKEKSNSFLKKQRKTKGGPSMVIQSKSTRGNRFFDLVTNAAITNQISFSAASDLLGLKVGSIRS